MGKRRPVGDLSGIVLCDKPRGLISTTLVGEVSRALGGIRAGHAGTLDPMATGLMVVGVGEGTKLLSFLLGHDKTYEAEITFGTATDTLDAEGKVTGEKPTDHLTGEAIAAVLETMVGPQLQVPPMYSALHQEGKRLHELARSGVEVDRKPREIVMHSLKLRSFTAGAKPVAAVEVACSKGTYVRSFAADLAEKLGTCAHLSALRRTRSGGLELANATFSRVPGADLRSAWTAPTVVPLIEAAAFAVRWDVPNDLARRVRDGQLIAPAPEVAAKVAQQDGEHWISAVESDSNGERLIAIGQLDSQGLFKSNRGFSHAARGLS